VKKTDLVLGVCAIVLGAVIVAVGKKAGLQFLRGTTPGPAFMPFLASWGMGLCGLALAVRSLKRPKAVNTGREIEKDADVIWIFKRQDLWNFFVVIGTSIAVIFLSKFLGLLISLALGVAVMTKLLGTPGWWTPIFVGIFSGSVFFGVFDVFLRVPLPRGIFGM
jgi:hypothetical protein